jgi:hypothetical protein
MRRTVTASMIFIALTLCAFAAAAEEKSPAYSFKFSGYFKGDIVYDDARVNSGNYALYVYGNPEKDKPTNLNRPDKDAMNVTARESRFSLDFTWKENEFQTDARFEFDFYGLGVSPSGMNSQENKPAPMLRHAYLQLTKGRWSLLAGQTSDIISPLVPKTVNYTVCWDQGNIGYRRPQFRMSAWGNASEKIKVSGALGAFRTLGGDLDKDNIDDGADAAVPTAEGRLAVAAKLGEKRAMEIGLSGHYGKEECLRPADTLGTGEIKYTKEIESWSRNVDLKVTLCDCFELMGEFFMGKDLGAYLGGVGQMVNGMPPKGIRAKGGWMQASYKPMDKIWLNIGYAKDDPDEPEFVPLKDPKKKLYSFIDANQAIFGSIMYSITSTVTGMLEVSQLTTTYSYVTDENNKIKRDAADFDDLRVQFALKAAIK